MWGTHINVNILITYIIIIIVYNVQQPTTCNRAKHTHSHMSIYVYVPIYVPYVAIEISLCNKQGTIMTSIICGGLVCEYYEGTLVMLCVAVCHVIILFSYCVQR